MVRLLRWASFIVMITIVFGAIWSYPILRDRFFSPMLAAQTSAIDVLPSQAATASPAAAPPDLSTARPITSTSVPRATVPAVIIDAPSPSATLPAVATAAQADTDAANPVGVATTSLLPASTITPNLPGPTPVTVPTTLSITQSITQSITATSAPTESRNIAVMVTPATPTPTTEMGAQTGPENIEAAAAGQKGALPPIAPASSATPMPDLAATSESPTFTPIVVATFEVSQVDVTPIVVTTVEISPSIDTPGVTPVVVTTVELTPPADTPTPLPSGPTANADGPLYGGPDFGAAVVGQVKAGQELTIVGMYTEGTWYLLVNGQWLPGVAVNNAPLTLPLVSPTITPVPTNTPTVTPTPFPSTTPLGSATPTPTATSLEQPVCDCSGDTLDCLGNIFANRAQSQQCFEYCFRQTGLDIHLLDPNLNGMACENLP